MTAVARRFATDDPVCCMVCRRQAWAIGHLLDKRVVWVCDDPLCLLISKDVFRMTAGALNEVERRSAADAGAAAGAYLDKLGKTDLAALSADEWRGFCETFVYAFEDHLKLNVMRRLYGEDWYKE